MPKRSRASHEEIRQVFEKMDMDKSGFLSDRELRWGLRELGVKCSSRQLESLMQRLDQNNDGKISKEEFAAFLGQLPSINAIAMFELFQSEARYDDANGEYTPPRACERRVNETPLDISNMSIIDALVAKLYSGCIAGAVSRTVTAPIDRLRMMMQTQTGTNLGFTEGLRKIWQEGGPRSFFRGNGVNIIKIAPETSIKFVVFDYLINRKPENPSILERFVAGGIAGAVAQISVYPMEVTRTRLGVSPQGTYRGVWDVFSKTASKEGFCALYSGLLPSIFGIIPYAGIDLATNSVLKEIVGKHLQQRGQEPGVTLLLGCGMASSSTAMICTYPLNLVRTRLQASGMPGAPRYNSAVDCFKKIVSVDGYKGLYRGMAPNLLKVLPATSISYTIYDLLSKIKKKE